ncbi:MAG TPA: two-component regulator propeller domain-containing protein [Acidobacteriota bacterium]|nr:two-component regulator propeller domain-containing protein [Acidobacteriota bacterium]
MLPGLLFGVFYSSPPVYAQYCFDSWTTDNGLPQNGLRAIAQTPDGYLWFTTFDGLVRFDGVRFTVFNRSNSKGIHSNRFTNLYVDQEGNLWAATEDKSLTIYRHGQFTSYTQADGLPEGLGGTHIFEFKSGPQGEVLILSATGWYQLRGQEFIFVEAADPNKHHKIYFGPSGTQWTVTEHAVYASKDGNLTTYPLEINLPELSPTVRLPNIQDHDNVYEDRHGNLWLGDLSGLYCLRDGAIRFYGEDDGIPANTLFHSFWEEPDGSLWFATGESDFSGIGLVRYKNNRFTAWGTEVGLSSDRILSVFKDREGTIWLAANRGLNRLRHQVVKPFPSQSGGVHREIYPILQTHTGDIYVGSNHGLAQIRGTTFTNFPIEVAEYESPVTALWEDDSQSLWVGAVDHLFHRVNGQFRLVADLPPLYTPVAIYSDPSGKVWIGTNKGLLQFQGEKLIAQYTTKDGLPSNEIKVIHQDRSGTLWIGTYGGLARLVNGSFVAITETDGLTGNRVRSIYEDERGTLWIGTYDSGLSRLQNGQFFNYRVENGLYDSGVFCILEDHRGWFWISCNRGIYRLSRQQLNDLAEGRRAGIHCIAYNRQDGMRNTECNGGAQPAGIKTNDGKLWFPTQDGLAVIDPESVINNPLPPPVLIESVVLEREAVAFQNGITIVPGQDDLEISYTGLSFIKSEQIKFKYKLEGKDEDWVDAGTRRTAYYTYIPPGIYTFRVIAANSDGVWNLEGDRIQIRVLAPFWQKGWFWLICGLSIIGMTVLFFRARVTKLKKQQEVQIAFSRRLIESQEIERKRIAAEMHDSLGQHLLVIKNWAVLGLTLSPSDAPNRSQLDEISETATTALKEVRQIVYDLRPYQLDKIGLTKTLGFMIEQVAESADLHRTSRLDNIDGWFSSDQEIIFYRIVQECLNNIVKHAQASSVQILIKHERNEVVLTVTDDGCGFEINSRVKSASGFGLTGLIERVQMLGGELTLDSAPGQGTSLTIRFRKKVQAESTSANW